MLAGAAGEKIPEKKLNYLSGRNDMTMLIRQPLLLITIFIIGLMLVTFVLLPIFNVFKMGATDGNNRFTLGNLTSILSTPSLRRTFYNSMTLGLIVAVIATVIGYLFAFAITRTEMKGKKFFKAIATLPIVSPPFILSLSIIFLFGRQGLITRGLLGIRNADVYGMHSLIVVQTLSFFPVAYLTLSGILESIDDSVEDAAYSLGATRGHIFRTVTLPLSLPGIISAMLLVFIQSMEDFSNPAVIAGSFSTLSVEAYRIITGMYDLHKGSMMAIVLLLPTVAAYLLQKYWMRKKSFVTITGKPTQKRRKLHEKHIVYPLFAACILVSAFIILLYGTALTGAFVKTWGVNYQLTLSHFEFVLSMGLDSLWNSVKLAVYAAPIGGILGMIIAYLTVRVRFPGRRAMEVVSLLTFAVPGTVLGIGYITSFNQRPLLFTGTAFILAAAFVFRNLPVAIESGTTTLLQIDKSIEEASSISGASSAYSFRRITLPLLRNAFFSGLVYAFVRAMTAVSAIIFLVSPRWPLATSKIFSLFEASRYSDAAAYVTLMIVIILAAIGIINILVHILLSPRAKAPREEEIKKALVSFEVQKEGAGHV
ncbi:ABC transporter permease protein [Treponema primitia ZAS-2]|uniref:ABC transporter permease protein n=1 Tax=Treponema primitia (strain ATCC BAA-887 / DSM 12427 / ZAS-2) TaxID=545694 RepID=F5YKF3_TREPZ|nr:iron ABC transporter permease [Treponema primitia]AEF86946.1 ABC transporter permease protein [Treponema primitia ZAS-2]